MIAGPTTPDRATASLWQLLCGLYQQAGVGSIGRKVRAAALVWPSASSRARSRSWTSLPLATAAVAGLTGIWLAGRIVAGLEVPLPLAGAQVEPPLVTFAASSQLPPAIGVFSMLPEPAAGPTDAAGGEDAPADGVADTAARASGPSPPLPTVPNVPAELDDVARELQRRRAEILELEAGLALREAALRAAEADLSAQIDRLEAYRQQLEALVEEAGAEEEARLQQLVKMYESMRAKSAAAIFDRLELPVILAVAKRMREARMAAILAAMAPDRARVVTTELARERELPRLD